MTPSSRRPGLSLNLLLLYGGEGLAKFLGLLAFALLGRELGDAGLGKLEFAIAVFFVLNLVMEAGLGPYGAREAAKHPERESELAGRIVSMRMWLLAGSAVLLLILAIAVPHTDEERRLLLLYGLALIPGPWMMNWAFQARDKMSVVACSTLARQTLFLGIVYFTVRSPESIHMVPIADAIGLGAIAVGQQLLYLKLGGRLPLTFRTKHLAPVAREAAPIAASTLTWALRMFAPTIALGLFVTSEDTGHFGAAHRLVVSLHTFAWLYFFNLLPSISRAALDISRAPYRELMKTSMTVVGWLVLPGCLALSFLAGPLLPAIYGEEFEPSAPLFQWIVWMPAIAFISGHYRYSLIAFGKVKPEFRANALGAAVAIAALVGLEMAGSFGPEKAAYVVLIAELATLVGVMISVAREIEPMPILAPLGKPVMTVAIAAFAAPWLLPDSPTGQAASTLVLGFLGLLAFDRHLIGRLRRQIFATER